MNTRPHPRTAALYLRISQDRTGEAAGIERQRDDCHAKAASLGLTVVGEYVDNGRSAYSGRPRPDFERMLDDARGGAFTHVVVWSTDRLYRRMSDLVRVTAELTPFASVVSVKGGEVELSSAEGIMRAQMLGSVAEFESRRKGERVARAAEQRASSGRWSGGMRPYAYEPDGVTIRECEAEVLRGAYADLVAGVSLREVTRRVNDAGHRTTTGKRFVPQHLRTLMLSPRFAGRASYRGIEVADADWPAVVDDATYRSAARILRDPDRRTTPGPAPRHLLSGVAVCGREGCGLPCRVSVTGGRGRPRRQVYRCPHGHVIRAKAALEEYVETITLALLEREKVRAVRRTATPAVSEAESIRGRLDELAELYAVGDLTREQVATASRTLRARLEAADAKAEAQATRAVLAPVTGRGARQAWEVLSVERRRAVLREVWGHITLVPGRTGVPGVNPDGVRMTPVWMTAEAPKPLQG